MKKLLFCLNVMLILAVSCTNHKSKVTFDKLRQLKTGMRYKQCFDLIGLPHSMFIGYGMPHSLPYHNSFSEDRIINKSADTAIIDSLYFHYYPCCAASKECANPTTELSYFDKTPSLLLNERPKLKLDFSKDGKLSYFTLYYTESFALKNGACLYSSNGFGFSNPSKRIMFTEQDVVDALTKLE